MPRRLALLVTACAIALILAECVARGVFFIDDPFFNRPVDRRNRLAVYAGAAYDVDLLFRELGQASQVAYAPYTLWRRRPFQGTLVNVAPNGERRTVQGEAPADAPEIWLFGGSTMWGTGVPDQETIPSLLAAQLDRERHVRARVRNLGEKGYVSTQELIRLTQELAQGNRPNAVIFYDGWNDVLCALAWPEERGAHFGLDRIRDRLEGRGGILRWIQSSGLYRATHWALWQLSSRWNGATEPLPSNEVKRLGEQAADVWIANYDLVAALGKKYGFVPVFTWQPARFEDAVRLGPFGDRVVTGQSMRDAYAQARARFTDAPSAGRSLHDLSNVFDGLDRPVFIDAIHTAGPGNERIAVAMLQALRQDACREQPAEGALAALCDER